ncbi:MAG: DUF1592 domain-containing protein [Novosphingobium sp.]|nr:DUF1592 domain-containing protein [Novosphingobium sp.]
MTVMTSAPRDRKRRTYRVASAGVIGAGFAALLLLASPSEPLNASSGKRDEASRSVAGGTMPGVRRLNEGQYLRSIEQVFGKGVKVPGRFSPPLREQGLMAIGDNYVSVTPSGIEQYELRAREISSQLLDKSRRAQYVSCAPAGQQFDEKCAGDFFEDYGRLLYRRPLTAAEKADLVGLARSGAVKGGDFYKGLEIGLTRLLVSPFFIFRVETSEADPADPSKMRLDAYSLATRLSFLFWDAPPDRELLDAAARGDLDNNKKLSAQVDRLIKSPRFEQGVRSFFSDMLGYEQFAGLTKDQSIFPKFNAAVAEDAREQTLRTIVDHLVTNSGDYRTLFTTRKTFINRNLGALYKVPVPEEAMDGWSPYEFSESDPRAGILSLAAFLMLDPTHEGRSSPTIRGKTVRELLLCQPVPQPPPNVDFAAVQDTGNPMHRTARQRLTIHQENPACAGCHALTDPIGLSIENYDAIGEYRTHENGALIDVSGSYNGQTYSGLLQFSRLLSESDEASSCLVQRTYEYGVGRAASGDDADWLEATSKGFAGDKYRFPRLMRRIAMSDAFRKLARPEALDSDQKVAAR